MSFRDIFEGRNLSAKTGEPLTICQFCSKPLAESDFYVIAKAYNKGRLSVEAVQCLECQEKASGYISQQSTENIQLYAGRRFKKYMEQPTDVDPVEPTCLFTGEELFIHDDFELYSVHLPWDAQQMYFLIGPTAVEQMSDLLSEETRKFWEKYMELLDPVSPEHVLSPMFLR